MSTELKEQLKKRLYDSIAAQIDLIDYVPEDLHRLIGDFKFDADILGPIPEDVDYVRSATESAPRQDSNAEANVADKDVLATHINTYYDTAFYSEHGITGILLGNPESEYRNIGYWDETTPTQHLASERLQDKLLEFIPDKTGRILDVACGMGASTRRLLNHYDADNIWAINISARQLESVKKNAEGCHAQVMNAVDMSFEDGFFDSILCIEAAFHFETRQKFLEESHRVLKQDGYLVLSDVLFTDPGRLEQHAVFPSVQNHIESVEEYRQLLSAAGFRNIIIQDVSKEVWGAHFLYTINRLHEEFYKGKLNIVQLTEILWTYYYLNTITGLCLFVCAQK
ncbi:MAG: methyltransferase domain-containing protein [Methylovulum sp.]|nr:methyltransferase domain-containing protein [Methylovulum sp.]